MKVRRLIIVLLVVVISVPYCLARPAGTTKQAAQDTRIVSPAALHELYAKAEGGLLWYCNSCEPKRMALLEYIRRSDAIGLEPAHYLGSTAEHNFKLSQANNTSFSKADQEISKIALRFSRDLYAGAGLDRMLSYDEVSPKYEVADMKFLIQSWNRANSASEITEMLENLQPRTEVYNILKKELQQLPASDNAKRLALVTSMSYYRWIHHFPLDSFIVVNIPAAHLKLYRGETTALQMRTVVGTPDSRTPRMASHVNEITLYPYWNMPRSMLVDEWFGIFKDNPSLIDYHDMELVDANGAVVPYNSISWKSMTVKNFPYRVRQKTGCENPLGVVKFGLNNPFDVYLHDTHAKGAFEGVNRFYSHGCVRVEDPAGLANAILPGKIDDHFLSACFNDQKPQVLAVPNSIPVFIVYMIAEPDDAGKVVYHRDIYELFK
jgi:murein L,D-transpeptidase YcbB/YkuD